MSEERSRILQMVNQGTVSAEEGARLLSALRSPSATPTNTDQAVGRAGMARWFRVRVTDMETGRTKVNVNLPLGLVKVGLRIGGCFAPEVGDVDWDDIVTAIQEGAAGKLVEVEDDSGERVEVFVD